MKNTKIMAVCVVFLAAMLFVGAASAANVSEVKINEEYVLIGSDSITVNITLDANSAGESIYNITNVSATEGVIGEITVANGKNSNETEISISNWAADTYTIWAVNQTNAGDNKSVEFTIYQPGITLNEEDSTLEVTTDEKAVVNYTVSSTGIYEVFIQFWNTTSNAEVINETVSEGANEIELPVLPIGEHTINATLKINSKEYAVLEEFTVTVSQEIPKPTLGGVTADLTEVDINTETDVNITAAYAINEYDTAEDYYLNITADSEDVTFDVESIQINASTKSPGEFPATINATTNETIEIMVQLMQGSEEIANKTVSITVNDTPTPVDPVVPVTEKTSPEDAKAAAAAVKLPLGSTETTFRLMDNDVPLVGIVFINEDAISQKLVTDEDGKIIISATETLNGIYIAEVPPTARADAYVAIAVSGAADQITVNSADWKMLNVDPYTKIDLQDADDLLFSFQARDGSGKSVTDGPIVPFYANSDLTGTVIFNLIQQTGIVDEWGNKVYAIDDSTDIPATSTAYYGEIDIAGVDYTYTLGINSNTPGPTPGDNKVPVTVKSGMDVFVSEYVTIDGETGSKLTKFTEGSNPGIVNQITADATGYFYLTAEVVGSNYGTYYLADTWMQVQADPDTPYVNIWYPELSIKAELTQPNGGTAGDSIDGKTVNKDTNVTFLVNAPKVGPAFQERSTAYPTNLNYPAYVKIVFTTPVNGKTTVFGLYSATSTQADFEEVELTASQTALASAYAGEDATAGTWAAQAEYIYYAPFADNAKKSNTITYTLQSSTLTITAAKDSVVRSNPFTVTISGKAQIPYAVYLETPATNEINPTLQNGQNGFQGTYDSLEPATNYEIVDGNIYYSTYPEAIGGVFKTDASGKRTIQFNTAANTEDKTYTIKVSGLTSAGKFDSSDYDKVKIKVEKGAVTISASGDGSYFLGDEIKLTGTNTDSTLVFMFITGKNLGSADGNVLKALPTLKQAALATNPVAVKTDNTWEYKWDTSRISIDPGAYTIYATSRLTNGKASTPFDVTGKESEKYGSVIDGETGKWAVKLSDSEYATISVNLKKPFLSAVPSGSVIAKGDNLYVRGAAEGNPSSLNIYIFGDNLFMDYSVSVEDDASYEKKIEIPDGMSSGQYFVVIQHPMMNGLFDAALETDANGKYFEIPNAKLAASSAQSSFYVTGDDRLPGSQAADALTKMIDSQNIDDIYTKLTFNVADAWIRISNPGDKAVGSKFTLTGTTNLAIDDQILVEVLSSSFEATDKTQDLGNSGITQTTKVVAGEAGDNVWTIEVDTTNWKLDEYMIEARGIEVDATTTTNFNLVQKVVTTTPTTAVPTGTTPTATTAKPTETPKSPGFGAFIALAGLGAVAMLVLRRN